MTFPAALLLFFSVNISLETHILFYLLQLFAFFTGVIETIQHLTVTLTFTDDMALRKDV